jgi:hypothetical protein
MQLDQVDHRWLQTHRYAVIDATRRDELPAGWPTTPIAPSFLAGDTDRCPLLLDIHGLSATEQAGLLEQCGAEVAAREGCLASLLIATDASTESLLKHLAKRLVIAVPPNPEPKQFRYFDPGTFLQLPRALGAQGMGWLLGPITCVWVPWAGGWGRLERPDAEAGFRMSNAQLQTLLDMSVINRVALQLDPPADRAQWCASCAAIDVHLQRGRTRGLGAQKDLVEFCVHAMRWHPRFDAHPDIQQLFKVLATATPEDELDYLELSRRISVEQWQRIQTELGRQQAEKDTPP